MEGVPLLLLSFVEPVTCYHHSVPLSAASAVANSVSETLSWKCREAVLQQYPTAVLWLLLPFIKQNLV